MLRKFVKKLATPFIKTFLVPSDLDAKEHQFRVEVDRRPSLSESEYLDENYSGASPFKRRLVAKVRNYLHDQLRIKSLLPHDDLAENFPDISFREIVLDLCESTGLDTDDLVIAEISPTPDGLVNFLNDKINVQARGTNK